MYRLSLVVAVLVLSIAAPVSPAASQPSPVEFRPGKEFRHKPSGMVIGPVAAGLPLTAVQQIGDQQLDIIFNFRSPGDTEITTVYIYRNVSGSVPVWFDRAQFVAARSPLLGATTLAYPAAAFMPAGRPAATGLRAAFSATGTAFKSSAVALTQVGEWYVKVRASSQTLTPQQLLARIDSTFAVLRWPKEKTAARAVAPVTDCPDALSLKPAAVAKASQEESMTTALLGGLIQQMVHSDKVKSKPVDHYCREPGTAQGAFGVYRPGSSKNHYMIALSDSGRAIHVGADQLGGLLSQGKAPIRYGVSLVTLDKAMTFPQFESMPTVEQAIEMVQKGRPLSSSVTWGKNARTVSISTN